MPADETKYTFIGAIIAGAFGLLAKMASMSVALWKSRHEQAVRQSREDRTDRATVEALAYAALKERIADLTAELTQERERSEKTWEEHEELHGEILRLRTEIFGVTQRHRAEMDTAERRYQELGENYGEALARIEALEKK